MRPVRGEFVIVDQMENWFINRGVDGYLIQPPILPAGLDEFVDKIIPELQNRGLFRTEYTGPTLRENLGLRRPASMYAATVDIAPSQAANIGRKRMP